MNRGELLRGRHTGEQSRLVALEEARLALAELDADGLHHLVGPLSAGQAPARPSQDQIRARGAGILPPPRFAEKITSLNP